MTVLSYVVASASALTLALTSLTGCTDEQAEQPADTANANANDTRQECATDETNEDGTSIQASPQRDGVGTSPSGVNIDGVGTSPSSLGCGDTQKRAKPSR